MRNRLDSYSGLIVGGQRLAIKQVSDDTRSFDSAQCECGSFLTFSTNHFGYVLESCPTCKYSRAMQPVPMVIQEAETPKYLPRAGICIEWYCTNDVIQRGPGKKTKRCPECTAKREREQKREWAKHNRPKTYKPRKVMTTQAEWRRRWKKGEAA